MLKSHPVRLLWHSLNWLTRIALVIALSVALFSALVVVTLRYWLLPGIEQFHGQIAASVSRAIGNPVSIGKIRGEWEGLQPYLDFTDVRILDDRGQPALLLPHINASISWLSIPTLGLRLSSLEIDQPELLVRRDPKGQIYVGSVAVQAGNANPDLSNWVLHQPHILVRNAIIVWQDETRKAPPLVLTQVNLLIANLFNHHRFSLRALPPPEVSSALDVRGDFHGKQFEEPEGWRGRLFVEVDRTDLEAWRPWITLPPEMSAGRGALRAWLGVKNGKPSRLTTDLALRDVSTQLSERLPRMDVQYLRGRVDWKRLSDGWEIETRRLAMGLKNGIRLQPTDFYFRTMAPGKLHPATGELRANVLDLETLTSLAGYFPLDAGLREKLDAYQPRGRASDLDLQWQIAEEKLKSYRVKGQFENLAMQQAGKLPGFSNLTASIDGSESGGNLAINARNLKVDAPGIMREPVAFATLTGQASWKSEQGELFISVANVAAVNDDLAGNAYGSYRTRAGTRGVIDLTVNLTRGDIRRAARYTPLMALHQKESDWLNSALLSGHTENFHLRLKGNLSEFPLNGKHDASLEITAHAEDASMQFAKDWPRIENLSGSFLIHDNRLEFHAPTASMLGARIHDLSVVLPDMLHADVSMEIQGHADATNSAFLQFVEQSPVRGYIDGFTDDIKASGEGKLDLAAQIPLSRSKPPTISGLFKIQGSDIDLGHGAPMLRNARGEISFTQSGIKTNNATATILGGPARLNVQTAVGAVHASIQGRANLDAMRESELPPLLKNLHGSTTWDANISVAKKIVNLTLNSNLQGISSSLPEPLTKSPEEVWPLRIERKNIAPGQYMIGIRLAKLLNARLYSENGESAIARGVVSFGEVKDQGADATGAQTGIWLAGNLPVLSMQGWGGFGEGPSSLPIAGANLHIDKLKGFGFGIDDLQITARKRGDSLIARLSGNQANGDVVWQPQGYGGSGKLIAHMHNLYLAGEKKIAAPGIKTEAQPVSPHRLPAMEIAIEDMLYKGKNIGRFELVGFPEGADWRLRRLRITNPDGTITGDGYWRNTQTQVKLLVDISNAGKILARSGYPNTVKNGSGKLVADLNWEGQPDDFKYATLDGTLNLNTGKGQFLKMDPGFGKLLGILSLQELPKRIALDFTDVFSSGFEFDSIKGNATIKHGVMQTDDLRIDGSSAKVVMKGSVNLNDETQDLHIAILPTLGSSISTLSAFAAGPVVGIGTFIVSKVLGNPLDKLMSFEYNVSGSWANPNVVKVGEKPVKVLEAPADAPKK